MQALQAGDPQRIGAYRLLARLGAGGMGQVFLARSDRGRTVAVKLVRRELAQLEEFRARFRQEVQAARRVGGHWTAPVLDADTDAAVPWVATGYVAGPSLQQVVGHDHGPLPERSVRILAAGLAGALQDIHAAGLVHRDLKPSNVLVTIDGPRVIDFGIARALETVTDDGPTRTGALVGSPGFMAPEQVRGDRVTEAADVFCLGSVLAYAATGALPFGNADSGMHVLTFRIAEEEPDLAALPEGIAELVGGCLRKDPAARPTLGQILQRTGAEDTMADGRFRDPWLPSALVAQLGRHAVRLLDAENPVGPAGAVKAQGQGRVGSWSGTGPGPGTEPGFGAAPQPEPPVAQTPSVPPVLVDVPAPEPAFAPAPQNAAAPPPGQPGGAGRRPVDRLPTMITGQTPPPGPPPAQHPAYGYPQNQHQNQHQNQGRDQDQNPYAAAYGYPQQPGAPAQNAYGDLGATPPYGPLPTKGPLPPYGPPPTNGPLPTNGPSPLPVQQEPRRGGGRSRAMLVVLALVVALVAGGSVYALMRGGDSDGKGRTNAFSPGPTPTAPTASGSTGSGPSPRTSQPDSPSASDGAVPTGFLGTWSTTITNAYGVHTRRLTIGQGAVGDTVLTLVADGPTETGGSYRCVFKARLAEQPDGGGPLEIGPSSVTTGPSGTCRPGAASEVTLLPGGRLQRVNAAGGEKLTYMRQ